MNAPEPDAYDKLLLKKFKLKDFFDKDKRYRGYFSEIISIVDRIDLSGECYESILLIAQTILNRSDNLLSYVNKIQSNVALSSGGDVNEDIWNKICGASASYLLWVCSRMKNSSNSLDRNKGEQ